MYLFYSQGFYKTQYSKVLFFVKTCKNIIIKVIAGIIYYINSLETYYFSLNGFSHVEEMSSGINYIIQINFCKISSRFTLLLVSLHACSYLDASYLDTCSCFVQQCVLQELCFIRKYSKIK